MVFPISIFLTLLDFHQSKNTIAIWTHGYLLAYLYQYTIPSGLRLYYVTLVVPDYCSRPQPDRLFWVGRPLQLSETPAGARCSLTVKLNKYVTIHLTSLQANWNGKVYKIVRLSKEQMAPINFP